MIGSIRRYTSDVTRGLTQTDKDVYEKDSCILIVTLTDVEAIYFSNININM